MGDRSAVGSRGRAGSIGSSTILRHAADLEATLGSPTRTNNGSTRVTYWSLPDGSSTGVGAWIKVPDDWTTANVKAVIANLAAASGSFTLRTARLSAADGETLGSGHTVDVFGAHTAGAADTRDDVEVLTGISVTAGEWLHVSFERVGGDAADDQANAMAVLGLVFEKAS